MRDLRQDLILEAERHRPGSIPEFDSLLVTARRRHTRRRIIGAAAIATAAVVVALAITGLVPDQSTGGDVADSEPEYFLIPTSDWQARGPRTGGARLRRDWLHQARVPVPCLRGRHITCLDLSDGRKRCSDRRRSPSSCGPRWLPIRYRRGFRQLWRRYPRNNSAGTRPVRRPAVDRRLLRRPGSAEHRRALFDEMTSRRREIAATEPGESGEGKGDSNEHQPDQRHGRHVRRWHG